MRRILVVYNPRSSKFGMVEREVLQKLRGLNGWAKGKFEVKATNVDENAKSLAKVILDGDLVVAAGGDATGTIAANGVMLAKKKDVRLGVLGYGNFNDVARSFGTKNFEDIIEGETKEVWPLECLINGKHYRWGVCYFTIGLFAEACTIFDEAKNRKALQSGKKSLFYSVWILARWYMKNRKRKFLENFTLESKAFDGVGKSRCEKSTDYVAVNGKTMAKMMKGGKWYLAPDSFLSEADNLASFFGIARIMIKSILRRVPGKEVERVVLSFDKEAKIMIQAEGEYKMMDGVEKIEIRKAEAPILAVCK